MEPNVEKKPSQPEKDAFKVEAPWDKEQVEALNFFQESGVFHPYTSARGLPLIATREGWRENAGGPVIQTWAHPALFDRKMVQTQLDIVQGKLPKIEQARE